VAALIHYVSRKKVTGLQKSIHHLWLNLLLAGGAIFGVVDHLWNGELFLLGENLVMDLLLGVTITVSLFVVWALIITLDKSKSEKQVRSAQ
jgi:hypothetical protein